VHLGRYPVKSSVDITGRLVRLRALRPDDAEDIARNVADPEVVQFLDNWSWRPYSVADAEEFVTRRDPSVMRWAIDRLEDGRFVGVSGLRNLDFRNRNCHWGIWIGPSQNWGKGYGSETCRLITSHAFRHLGMEKVYLAFYEGNERGRRAYEKAGYRLEGTLPRDAWHDGRFVTSYVMAAYRDDPFYSQ
jgi:RimJ/RimL family protein N-acetyltransferase